MREKKYGLDREGGMCGKDFTVEKLMASIENLRRKEWHRPTDSTKKKGRVAGIVQYKGRGMNGRHST
jgi:hypothetical protein